jgi:hypothetical protein
MEFLLLWWDNLDDVAHACRHVATEALMEVSALTTPITSLLAAAGAWVLLRLPG